MENIQVIVRIRPINLTERDGNDLEIWSIANTDTITIANDRFNDLVRMRKFVPGQRVEFTFNNCFEQKHSTGQLYKQQIQRIVLSALQGINGTVFMYGQTGSGKTFTMMGPERDGVLPLALNDVFGEISKQTDKQYFLRCSYMEIYTDQVHDLLATQERLCDVLQINEDYNREFVIKGATEEIVSSIEEITDILKFGETNRHYASTIMNHCSSRSHTIFRLYVRCVPNVPGPGSEITESILNFVDLAGSEKINIHDSLLRKRGTSAGGSGGNSAQYKDRQNESKHINKSLFFLTQVISLRSQGKSDLHIPYRNSPLTKILRSSLGGNSRTAIILCVNPCYSQFDQTLSTLRFGMNAKKIENNVKKNVVSLDNDEALNRIISEYESKIQDLEKERDQDKHQADMMMKFIERLEEQRKYFKQNFQASEHIKQIMQKEHKHEWNHLHYNGIGVLWVPSHDDQPGKLEVRQEVLDQFETIKKCKSFQDQTQQLSQQMQLLDTQLTEARQKVADYRKRHSMQKTKTLKYKQLSKDLQEERNKLMKIALLYHNHLEIDEMMLLSNENLDTMLDNIQVLMQNILKVKLRKELRIENGLKLTQCAPIKYSKYFFDTSAPNVQFWDIPHSPKVSQEMQKSEIESFQSYFQKSYGGHSSPSVKSSVQQFKEPFKHICSNEKSASHRGFGKENLEPSFKKNSSVPDVDGMNFGSYFK